MKAMIEYTEIILALPGRGRFFRKDIGLMINFIFFIGCENVYHSNSFYPNSKVGIPRTLVCTRIRLPECL